MPIVRPGVDMATSWQTVVLNYLRVSGLTFRVLRDRCVMCLLTTDSDRVGQTATLAIIKAPY